MSEEPLTRNMVQLNAILQACDDLNLERPSIFDDLEEQDQRLEWVTPISHTVLTFQYGGAPNYEVWHTFATDDGSFRNWHFIYPDNYVGALTAVKRSKDAQTPTKEQS